MAVVDGKQRVQVHVVFCERTLQLSSFTMPRAPAARGVSFRLLVRRAARFRITFSGARAVPVGDLIQNQNVGRNKN